MAVFKNTDSHSIDISRPTLSGIDHFKNAIHEAHAIVGAPYEMCYASALINAGIATQPFFDIRLPTGQLIPPVLNIIVIAESGERKTGITEHFSKEIDIFEEKINYSKNQESKFDGQVSYETAMEMWRQKERILKKKLNKFLEEDEVNAIDVARELDQHRLKNPSKNVFQITFGDSTREGIFEIMKDGNKNVALKSDEGKIMLNWRFSESLPHYNSAWDSGKISINRKTSGLLRLSDARISISIMIQKKPFNDFLKNKDNSARDNGFMARTLILEAVSIRGKRENLIPPINQSYTEWFHDRMKSFLNRLIEQKDLPKMEMKFSPEAAILWNGFRTQMEMEMKDGGYLSDARDCASKMPNIAARFAGIIQMLCNESSIISTESILFAINACYIHIDEYKRLICVSDENTNIEFAAYKLHEHIYDRWDFSGHNRGFDATYISQKSHRSVRNNAKFRDKVIQHLLSKGILGFTHVFEKNRTIKVYGLKIDAMGDYPAPELPRRTLDPRWTDLLRTG